MTSSAENCTSRSVAAAPEENTPIPGDLLSVLTDLNVWLEQCLGDVERGRSSVSTDTETLQECFNRHLFISKEVNSKRTQCETALALCHDFLSKNDANSFSSTAAAAASRSPRSNGTRAHRQHRKRWSDLARQFHVVQDRWQKLLRDLDGWRDLLDDTQLRIEQLSTDLVEVRRRLSDYEAVRQKWSAVRDVPLGEIAVELDQLRHFEREIRSVYRRVERLQDVADDVRERGIALTRSTFAKIEDVSMRWQCLQMTIEDRVRQLEDLQKEFGPNSQFFLRQSVEYPWERTVSGRTQVPYFIHHSTETTSWDHPKMTQITRHLSTMNGIRFAAYRTAMKLRFLQKRFGLDLIKLEKLKQHFSVHSREIRETAVAPGHGSRPPTVLECVIDVQTTVRWLRSLFEELECQHPGMINSVVIIDLFLNWLLNIFDPSRSGRLRILSLRVLLCLLCSGPLEDKYRYLFLLVANASHLKSLEAKGETVHNGAPANTDPPMGLPNGSAVTPVAAAAMAIVYPEDLRAMLNECLQIIQSLGEVAAFGGSNAEASVRSCLKFAYGSKLGSYAKSMRTPVALSQFLAWLSREPQSMVWMPVLYRVANAEFLTHQCKCNICKEFPIVGLRYRCLKCFNFDLCQSCFFSGRHVGAHRLSHPMREYCQASTFRTDFRDLRQVILNKICFRTSRSSRPPLGYMPIDSVPESAVPIGTITNPRPPPVPIVASKSATFREVHHKLESYAQRLARTESSSVRTSVHSQSTTSNRCSLMRDSASDEEHRMIGQYCSILDEQASGVNQKNSAAVKNEPGVIKRRKRPPTVKSSSTESASSLSRVINGTEPVTGAGPRLPSGRTLVSNTLVHMEDHGSSNSERSPPRVAVELRRQSSRESHEGVLLSRAISALEAENRRLQMEYDRLRKPAVQSPVRSLAHTGQQPGLDFGSPTSDVGDAHEALLRMDKSRLESRTALLERSNRILSLRVDQLRTLVSTGSIDGITRPLPVSQRPVTLVTEGLLTGRLPQPHNSLGGNSNRRFDCGYQSDSQTYSGNIRMGVRAQQWSLGRVPRHHHEPVRTEEPFEIAGNVGAAIGGFNNALSDYDNS